MPKRKPKPARKPRPALAPAARPDPSTYDGWHHGLTETERRIDDIVHKMQSGAWLTGVSDRALAKEWNLSPDRMKQLSAEASRVVRRALRTTPEAQEEARAEIIQTFQVIRAKAMGKGSEQGLRVALDAVRAYGFYMGVEPAKRLDVSTRDDPFEGWSVSELEAYANENRRPARALRRLAAEDASNGAALDTEGEERVH